ncbi:hypothetical protein C474_12711 [Halogeometricum pallidum JCM 14848]|uniref:Uncharacterized protein n=1 Tax=Halogeometricum pallidum JCM 14848 TaxID=1227487 RepID=M0D5D6_HALPD|nr:hypothetical protein [Halogeometricum pallidum]ELZ29897.1 hypothetical protein C474_12711 [Halogeometricum pallidum JCM 14848]
MSVERRPSEESSPKSESVATPQVSVCESRPGRSVFLESGNADGWIATDLSVSVSEER